MPMPFIGFLCFLISLMLVTCNAMGRLNLVPHNIYLKDGTSLRLSIPEGFNISVAAQGMKRLRFLAKSPDGKLFATDMYDRSDNTKGKIYLLAGWDNKSKSFIRIIDFARGLRNPNQVAFYSTNGSHYLYIAELHQLTRFKYVAGDTSLRGKGEVIATFPDYGLSYKYGGWHLTRSISFYKDKLYVSVGSSCNACLEKEPVRATVLEMDPDGKRQGVYASGLRNSVGIKWVDNKLWVTSMGRDLLGPDKPEDLFHNVERGGFYGWPYYFQYQRRIYTDVSIRDSVRRKGMAVPPKPPVAFHGFKAHVAPLGFDHFKGFADERLNNNFLVSLHGSTSVWRQRGNSVVMIDGKSNEVPFITGFLEGNTEKGRKGRPCDVLMYDERSFFVTDDHRGVLYYVWKE
jgi:glucose/arabinose dehydrogenase